MRRKRTVGWAYGLTWGRQGIQGATLLILGAIVGPADFGVMALALIYVGFTEIVLQQGFVAAIIQRKVLRQSHVSSVFWLMIGFSLLLASLGLFFARYWASLNKAPTLGTIIPILAVTVPLLALQMVPTALLTRHLRMKALAIRSVAASAIAGIVAVSMAFAGWGVWALVAQHVCYSAASTVFVWNAVRWRPRLTFKWGAARDLLPFSLANFTARAGKFLASQVDAIIIGLFWGPAAVGLYRLAARCTAMALDFLAGPLQFVALPEFSKLQNNQDLFRESLLTYLRSASLVTWPSLAMIAVMAPYVPSLLGAQWSGVEYALAALALCAAIDTMSEFLAPLLQSVGRPGTLAGIVWVQALAGAAVFVAVGSVSSHLDIAWQIASIGLARVLLVAALPLPALLFFAARLLDLPAARILLAVAPAMSCAATVYVIGLIAREGLHIFSLNVASEFVALAVLLAFVWIFGIVALNAGARRFVVDAARRYSPMLVSRF